MAPGKRRDDLHRDRQRLTRMLDAVTNYTYSVEIHEGRAISTEHSKGCLRITGYSPEDYLSDSNLWYSMIYPEDRGKVWSAVERLLSGKTVAPLEHRIVKKDGSVIWIRNTIVPSYDAKGRLTRYDGLIEDITARKINEDVLRRSEAKFRALAETANDAVILADSGGNIIFWNQSAGRIFGYAEDEIMNRPLTVLMPERFRDSHLNGLKRVLQIGSSSYIGRINEMQAMRKDESVFPIELSVSMWKMDGETYFSGIIRDITKRKSLEKRLEELAATDTLTGAYNRTKFDEIINRELQRAARYGHPLALIMFDIDHFKRVNDTFGHIAGDGVLSTISRIVRGSLRESDYLVRWGGEEFVIVATETEISAAHLLSERIRRAVGNHPFEEAGRITISLGVTQYRPDDTADEVIRRADAAMYRAKTKGRNQTVKE